MPDEGIAESSGTGEQVDHSGRNSGSGNRIDDEADGQRRHRGGLDDHGAPGQKRGSELDDDEVDREVPRRDERADSDRILAHHRIGVGGSWEVTEVLIVEPSGQSGEMSEDAGRIRRRSPGLRDRGAVLQGVRPCQVFGSCFDLLGDPHQVFRTRGRGQVRPFGHRFLCCGHRSIEFRRGGCRHRAPHFVRRRIDDGVAFGIGCLRPRPIDEMIIDVAVRQVSAQVGPGQCRGDSVDGAHRMTSVRSSSRWRRRSSSAMATAASVMSSGMISLCSRSV